MKICQRLGEPFPSRGWNELGVFRKQQSQCSWRGGRWGERERGREVLEVIALGLKGHGKNSVPRVVGSGTS